MSRQRLTKESIKYIGEHVYRDKSVKELAQELKVTQWVVYQAAYRLKREGAPIARKARVDDAYKEIAAELNGK